MLTTTNAGALVGTVGNPVANKHIRVERPFYFAGKPVAVGAVLEVPAGFAAEMVAVGKAVVVSAPARPPETKPELAVQPVAIERPSRRRKE